MIVLPSNAYQGEYIRQIAQCFFNLHQQTFQIDSEEIFRFKFAT